MSPAGAARYNRKNAGPAEASAVRALTQNGPPRNTKEAVTKRVYSAAYVGQITNLPHMTSVIKRVYSSQPPLFGVG